MAGLVRDKGPDERDSGPTLTLLMGEGASVHDPVGTLDTSGGPEQVAAAVQPAIDGPITEFADPNLPWHLPFSVDGLNVVALWAHQLNRELRYVRVTHQIVDRHAGFLSGERALLMGDFNSNSVWDRQHPGRNHSMLVEKLGGLGLSSVYHRDALRGEGAESTKTYFHTRNRRFGHHIDYAFLSDGVPAQLKVGDSEDWLAHSDHMPLILDIE